MPQRQYNAKRCKVTKVNKRIVLPITWAEYRDLSQDASTFRDGLEQMIATCPELFSRDIVAGYTLHDVRYLPPVRPGYSIEMRPESLHGYEFPIGKTWAAIQPLKLEGGKAMFIRAP
jgi:hypothetical protein